MRLRDATTAWGVLAVCGPQSRALMQAVGEVDFSTEAFPFNSLRHFHIGHAPVFAQRLSYTGELGWEIFVTPDFAEHVFDVLMAAGAPLGLRPVGGEALNALRIEKGFVHWGHDMAYTEAPHQVGLGFACKPDKATPFIGRDAFLARREAGEGPYLCAIRLRDPGPLLHHNEPVLRDGVVAGFVTSGAWCRAGGAATGLCFVNMPEGGAGRGSLKDGAYSVMVEGRAVPADLSLSPFHDPKNARMLG